MVRDRQFEMVGERVIVLNDRVFPLYIIRGEKNFLVDSGVTAMAEVFHQRIEAALEQFAHEGAGKIHTLLLTHTHWDHTGSAYFLQRRYGFNVFGSRHAVGLLRRPKVIGFIDRLNQDFKKMKNVESDSRFDQLEDMESVSQGDRIPVDSHSYLEVIETPGHTRCSVAYLLQPDRILFLGDASGVMEPNRAIKPLFLSSYLEYEASIRKLMALDVEVLAFPHNRVVRGRERVSKHFQNALTRARAVKELIREHLRKGDDITKVAEMLCDREFPNPTLLGPRESIMINMEMLVKVIKKAFPDS